MNHLLKAFGAGLLALAFAFAFGFATAQAAPPPVEAFFARPSLLDAELSPDGRRVALVLAPKGARARLAVLDLQTMKPLPVAGFEDQDIRRVWWVNDQRLLFDMQVELTGPGRTDIGHGLFAVNADGSGFRHLVQSTGTAFFRTPDAPAQLPPSTTVLNVPRRGGSSNEVVVGRPQEISRDRIDYYTLQRLNTATGRAVELDLPLHARHWGFDASGEPRAAITQDKGRGEVMLRQADGSWKAVGRFDVVTGAELVPRAVGPDGTVYAEAAWQGYSALFALDPATGLPAGKPIAAAKGFDLHPAMVFDENRLIGLHYRIDADVTQWLDPAAQALQARIDQLLPATANRITLPRHGDSPWVLVQAGADVQPMLAYAFDRSSGRLVRLGGLLPEIDRREMAPTDFLRIRARDGLEFPVWLTLPRGGGRKPPLVVLVHGGPWLRGHWWHWDAEVQFLASRGYAVLQPEFRGSRGWGNALFEAGHRQWGRAMQDDIADAAAWAVAQGHADPKRICIAGASYGGYATLMGLVRDPQLFRCGVAWVAVTDIDLLFSVGWSDLTNEVKAYSMSQLIGDPATDAERFKASSPLQQATRITQPLLLAYGGWDRRVPLIHGEKFRDAVKLHNANMEWVVYGNEGHGWQRPENQADFWGRVERFLDRHLKNPPP